MALAVLRRRRGWWLIAAGAVVACASAAAQDADKTVAVEAAKVVAAPLSEQVTAVGTLLSDEAVTVSSEIAGRLQEIHFEEGTAVEKGVPLFTLDKFGLSGSARGRRSQTEAGRADPSAHLPAVQEQIRHGAIGRRSHIESGGQQCHGRTRPRAAREDADRGAVLRHCRAPPCERGRIHHRRPAAGQSRVHRSGEGGFPRAGKIPAGDQGGADNPHQGRRLSRRYFRGEGLRHRPAPRRRRPQPARPRQGPKHRSAAASGPVRPGDGVAPAQGGCAERAGTGHRAARRRSVRVQDRRRQGAHDQGGDRHQA